jgi:regulation of enolase protein 1 (concanavalin A-like superfamily)
MTGLHVQGFPYELTPVRSPDGTWEVRPDGVRGTAPATTDVFTDPVSGLATRSAPLLTASIDGDFQFSARISAQLRSLFDAGVLYCGFDEDHWFKFCFELSPAGIPTVVSVVTRGVSDDANSWPVNADNVYLRVSRIGATASLHASADGREWALVRHFALPGPGTGAYSVGFLVQSPTGPGCTVDFDEITLTPTTLKDNRDGS